MQYVALATDYDGTIAHHGNVDEATIAVLEKLRTGARRVILVTGRELPDLRRAMPRLDVFDVIVAENGALLDIPATKEERPSCQPRTSDSSPGFGSWRWSRFRSDGPSSRPGSRTRPRCWRRSAISASS